MGEVDEIKQRLDIVDVLSGYLRLEKAGSNLKALCPFHTEKTPSFIVFPRRQSWRCFGCGASGDVFGFIMKREGIGFGEALRVLAERAGVTLAPRKAQGRQDQERERLHQINEAAASYYHHYLLHGPAAHQAREYVKRRELTPETVERFQLGFSPGEGLRQHLSDSGFSEAEQVAAGLVVHKEDRSYEFFRHRLMFVVRDPRGRALGFGARALDDTMPKYLNSPQSAVFDKGSVLYGIDGAANSIREQDLAIIVEGYMDVLTAHQHGITNVVASMGTALTEKQLKLLKGLTKRLALALDPDAAGDAATLRGIDACRRALDRRETVLPDSLGTTSRLDSEIKIIPLPEGKDPDNVIRESMELWRGLVDGAVPFTEHLLALVAAKKMDYRQVLPLITELGDDVERELYLGKLAGLVGVSVDTLRGIAAQMRPSRPTPKERAAALETRAAASTGLRDAVEERCLSLLLQYPELRTKASALLPEHFERSENRELFTAWRNNPEPQAIAETLDAELHPHLEELALQPLPPTDEKGQEQALADCIYRLEKRRLTAQLQFVTSQAEPMIAAAGGREGEGQNLAPLLEETIDLQSKLVRGTKGETRPPRGGEQ